MTEPMLAFDSDPFAAAEGRAPLRTGVPAWPLPATDAIQETRPMDDKGLIQTLGKLYKFLGDKLSPDDLQAVQALFSGPDSSTLNSALGMDRMARTKPGQVVDYAKMFPNMHRLDRS